MGTNLSRMKISAAVVALTTVSASYQVKSVQSTFSSESIQESFDKFLIEHGKSYSPEEYKIRLAIYTDNYLASEGMNMNFSGDFTAQETLEVFPIRGLRFPEGLDGASLFPGDATVEKPKKNVDYRECYGEARDQGNCGSCWAFAAAATLQGAYCKKYGKEFSANLSVENVASCVYFPEVSTNAPLNEGGGCDGGGLDEPLDYFLNNSITTEDRYPYTMGNKGHGKNQCKNDVEGPQYKASSRAIQIGNNAKDLIKALDRYGPLSVAIGATPQLGRVGKDEVVTARTCGVAQLNHAVNLVGYKTIKKGKQEKVVFILKNSWSRGWADEGYALFEFGACQLGALTYATIAGELPTVDVESLRM